MSSEPPERPAEPPADTEVYCTIIKAGAPDDRGRGAFEATSDELCVVLKLPGVHADVSARIGSAPDRPSTPPGRDDAILLLRATTRANVNDAIEVAGIRLKVTAIAPSYDSVGKLACHVAQAVICDAAAGEIRGD